MLIHTGNCKFGPGIGARGEVHSLWYLLVGTQAEGQFALSWSRPFGE